MLAALSRHAARCRHSPFRGPCPRGLRRAAELPSAFARAPLDLFGATRSGAALNLEGLYDETSEAEAIARVSAFFSQRLLYSTMQSSAEAQLSTGAHKLELRVAHDLRLRESAELDSLSARERELSE